MAAQGGTPAGGPPPKLRIRYPKNDATIPSRQFVATGIADKSVGPITGYLIDENKQTYQGKVVKGPPDLPRWLMAFKGIPPGGPYTLVVQAEGGEPSDEVKGLRVLSSFPPIILYPPCPSEHCNENFIAYGYADPQVDTATMNGIGQDDIYRDGFFWAAIWYWLMPDTYLLVVTDYDLSATECACLELREDLCML